MPYVRLIPAILAFMFCWQAEGRTVASETWQLNATCSASDLWASWSVNGHSPSDGPFIVPFTDHPIDVIGFELVKIHTSDEKHERINRTVSWFNIGSTMQPDVMLWLAPGHTHAKTMWPAGTKTPWPSRKTAKPLERIHKDGKLVQVKGDLIDVHGLCFGGAPITLFLTIYYVAADQ